MTRKVELQNKKIYKGRFYIMSNNIPENESVVKKAIVNCPKCSTSLNVKIGDYANLCPVCGKIFRARFGARLVKDISDQVEISDWIFDDEDTNN